MHRSSVWATIVLLTLLLTAATCPAAGGPPIGKAETEIGAQASSETDKSYRLVTDDAVLARVRTIGGKLAAVANATALRASYGSDAVTPFDYRFKVIDEPEVNAFSIPGGHVYVYKGLLDFCESDHELAAVLAHEIAHAAHHHMAYLMREQARLDGRLAVVLLAGLATKTRGEDLGNVLMGTQFYKISRMSGWTEKAEQDADATAITYLAAAGYNPVGELTFLERLADRPDVVEWGIFQDHPKAADRARDVRVQLVKLGLPINRSAVSTSCSANVSDGVNGAARTWDVTCNGSQLCRFASERAARGAAEGTNRILDMGLPLREVRLTANGVEARGAPILEFSPEDEAALGKPAAELAEDACRELKRLLYGRMVRDLW